MVIMLKIGQSAALLTKPVMAGHVRRSTTAWVSVPNDSLANWMGLKVQSGPRSKGEVTLGNRFRRGESVKHKRLMVTK